MLSGVVGFPRFEHMAPAESRVPAHQYAFSINGQGPASEVRSSLGSALCIAVNKFFNNPILPAFNEQPFNTLTPIVGNDVFKTLGALLLRASNNGLEAWWLGKSSSNEIREGDAVDITPITIPKLNTGAMRRLAAFISDGLDTDVETLKAQAGDAAASVVERLHQAVTAQVQH